MKTRTEFYKERTEKERNKFTIIFSALIVGIILMAYGFSSLVEDIESSVSCNGTMSCLIMDLGSLFLVFIGLVLSYCLISLFVYGLSQYRLEKETTK